MVRTALCAVLALAFLPAAASAAPKSPGCTDPRGDVRLTDHGPVVDAPQLDLVSVDAALGRSETVFVIRTAGPADGVGVWQVTFTVGKTTYYAYATRGAGQAAFTSAVGIVGGAQVPHEMHYDSATRTFVMRAKSSSFGKAAPRPGARITQESGVAREKLVAAGDADVSLVDYLDCASRGTP